MLTPFAYREYYTVLPLAQLVRKFWVLDNAHNAAAVTQKNLLPNGCFDLAFIAGSGVAVRGQGGHQFLPAGHYFGGQARACVTVDLLPFTHVTLVQVHPWAVAALTPASIAGTADAILPLQYLLPTWPPLLPPAPGLPERAVIAFVEQHLGHLPGRQAPMTFLKQACQLLQHTHGQLSIQAVAQQVGCSRRLLEKRFHHHLGLTPKEFAAVLRVRSAVDTLHRPGPAPALAQVALEHGFHDQAHFGHAFRRLVQQTPGRFDAAAYVLPLTGTGY